MKGNLLRFLVGFVLAGGALVALAQGLRAQERPRVSIRVDSMSGDSLRARVFIRQGGGPEVLVRELMRSRAMEDRLALELDRASDEGRRRALEQQLAALIRTNAGLLTRLELQCSEDETRPTGYLGVSFTGEFAVSKEGDADPVFRFSQWPLIESVEPGSPAAEAGVEPGDKLVAIDKLDVSTRPVVFNAILKPGKRVALRVQREGEIRELTATVKARPGNYGSPCQSLDLMLTSRLPMLVRTGRTLAATAPGAPPRPPRPPSASAAGAAPTPPSPPEPPTAPMPFVWAGSGSFVAGAQLRALDADLREFTEVERGVFVVNVAQGTPARESGLRAGDVITAADDVPVGTVAALQRQVGAARGESVKLNVVRKGKGVVVRLRW